MKPMFKSRHLEVMVGGCGGSEFAAIREFFEQRGYRLTESRQGDVYRLWAEPPRHLNRRYATGLTEERARDREDWGRPSKLSAAELRLAGVRS